MDPIALTVFHAAADRLWVSRSAVTQAIRTLEEALNGALVRRTSRDVSTAEGGAQLHSAFAAALADSGAALEAAAARRDRPREVLRLAVSSITEALLSGLAPTGIAEVHHEVRLDILLSDENSTSSSQTPTRACASAM